VQFEVMPRAGQGAARRRIWLPRPGHSAAIGQLARLDALGVRPSANLPIQRRHPDRGMELTSDPWKI